MVTAHCHPEKHSLQSFGNTPPWTSRNIRNATSSATILLVAYYKYRDLAIGRQLFILSETTTEICPPTPTPMGCSCRSVDSDTR
ncbi:hypothetical protein GJ496_008658 [Pomphorhynchus laevis]|nr:hypothetical protein GJ496_008658 [Pomphorhynchus laevis]